MDGEIGLESFQRAWRSGRVRQLTARVELSNFVRSRGEGRGRAGTGLITDCACWPGFQSRGRDMRPWDQL